MLQAAYEFLSIKKKIQLYIFIIKYFILIMQFFNNSLEVITTIQMLKIMLKNEWLLLSIISSTLCIFKMYFYNKI